MSSALDWIRKNKLASLLIVIVAFFIFKNNFLNLFGASRSKLYSSGGTAMYDMAESIGVSTNIPRAGGGGPVYEDAAPAPEVSDRMVVQNSYLSLVVKKVSETLTQINQYTESAGGYMVSRNLSNPQDAASANITVRIPASRLDETLLFFKGLAIKVSSERLDGHDVTDEYVDIDSRLSTLRGNLSRFKEIMYQTQDIDQIIKVQEKIFQLQDQIDRLMGRQKFLTETSKTVKITIYLSTDEYSLPYAPSDTWRPEVIFKTAVRSLIQNLRKLANTVIWIVVYSIIWIPALLAFRFIKGKLSSKKQ